MADYTISRNDNTGRYEVHVAGCRHSNFLDVMATKTGESAKAGRISWFDLYDLARQALDKAITEVAR